MSADRRPWPPSSVDRICNRAVTNPASVAVDAAGNAFISGYTHGGLGDDPNTYGSGRDAFLSKYDPNGSLLWSRQLGTPGEDVSWSVSVDAAGNAFISGYTDGSLGDDPNTYGSGYDAF